MFIIPDELFDYLRCDICNKVLSVGPVKVYPNRKRKCGRCSNNDKDGAISQYNLIMKHCIFKCVNRFDGCNVLLSSNQVENHESTCNSKTNVCPVCPKTTEIPTFLLVSHFAKFHKDSLLSMPSFDMDVTSPNTKTYLYKVKDNLFFIESACSSKDKISFKAIFLGDVADAPTIKWFLTIQYRGESRKVDAIRKSGDSYDCITASKVDIVHVDFEQGLKKMYFSKMLIKDESAKNPLKITLPRKIFFESPNATLDSNLIVRSCYSIDPRCYNCSMPVSDTRACLEVGYKKFQPICPTCKMYYLNINPNLKFANFKNEYYSLSYSCIWCSFGCSKTYCAEKILEHETKCSLQPLQQCPVPFCKYRLKLFNLEEHFRETHPFRAIKLYPRFRILFQNEISTIFCEEWYVWVQHAFVVLKISRQNKKWRVHIEALGSFRYDPRFLMIQNGLKFSIKNSSCEFEGSCSPNILCYFGDDHLL